MTRVWRGAPFIAAMTLATSLISGATLADPWIPAAGDGVAKPMIRSFRADDVFSPGSFGTGAQPGSSQELTQFRVTGTQGLGHRFSLEYDLRAGWLRSSRVRHNQPVTASHSGLQDQEIGLNYGLAQRPNFAVSVTFNVIAPVGATNPPPALGSGVWAVEPDYQVGLVRGPVALTLQAGPRIFLDGGAAQLRANLDISIRPRPRLALTGSAFFVRTIQQGRVVPVVDQGEIYNLLRLGVGAEYQLTSRFRPFVAYQVDVAGKAIHAGRRIVFGVAIHY